MRKIDLKGLRFGYLVVICESEKQNKKRGIYWLCKCDCGNEKVIASYSLNKGNTKSCGCLRAEKMSETMSTHRLTCKTRLYNVWSKMKQRCVNEKCHSYNRYGGRGISVCAEWYKDFQAFYDWALSHGYEDHLTIDRIDYNGNYEPANCRFLSNKDQQRNKSSNLIIEFEGGKKPLSEWCEEIGINYHTTHQRIRKYGWSVEKAFAL